MLSLLKTKKFKKKNTINKKRERSQPLQGSQVKDTEHPLTLSLRPNRTPLAYSFPPTLLYTPNLYLIQWSSHTPSNLLPIQQAFHKLWVYPYHGNASNPWFPTYFWYAPYPRHKFNYRCHSHLIISALPQPNPFHHFFLSLIHPR